MSDFKVKFTKFDLGWGSAQTPLGELTALPRGPSESFAVVCTLVHCNCFVLILFAMPIPDTFALDVGKSVSSICVNIVVRYKDFDLPAVTALSSLQFTVPLLSAEHFRLLTLSLRGNLPHSIRDVSVH